MHLWPTKTIRESWKLPYLSNFERVISQKRAARRAEEQKLLDNDDGNGAPTGRDASCGGGTSLRCLCRDFVFIFTCCFCCGACMDELDFYSSY